MHITLDKINIILKIAELNYNMVCRSMECCLISSINSSIDEDLWHYVFTKADDVSQLSLADIGIFKGERVMISEENCKTFGLCFGKISLKCSCNCSYVTFSLVAW